MRLVVFHSQRSVVIPNEVRNPFRDNKENLNAVKDSTIV
jgi:hypothetical protein